MREDTGSILPELMRFADGRRVETPEQWAERRKEILALFETSMYGRMPDPSREKVTYEIVPGSVQGGDAGIGELARVGGGHQLFCLCLVKIGQEGREDLRRETRIVQRQKAAPVDLGDFAGGHDVEAAVGGKPVHDRAGGRNRARAAAGALIQHEITS